MFRGSWVVISRVTSRVTIVITYIRGLITPLITTHEPPSGHSSCESGLHVRELKLYAMYKVIIKALRKTAHQSPSTS